MELWEEERCNPVHRDITTTCQLS